MRNTTVGAGALRVGAIGLGCMPMSWAYTASERDGQESVRTVHAALDLGATLLDTADSYGPFTNELLLGRALLGRRETAFVATKGGLLASEGHLVTNGRPDYIRRACDASLRRLRTDWIDLYQLHRPDPDVPVEESWGAMAELVRAGKVRSLGLSALDVIGQGPRRPSATGRAAGAVPTGGYGAALRLLDRVQQVFPVGAVQAELSVWAPRAATELLPWCRARGVTLLAAMPLGSGYLTGTLTAGRGFEPDDARARHPRFTAAMMAEHQPVVAALRRVAARHGGVTTAQVALAWLLALGDQVIPVPGTKKERWVRENCAAAGVVLTPSDLVELRGLPEALDAWG
ncbi:aldo/keto reductase [Streptomyces spiramenti]|uniref:Aldo/keto reductase n=1 Tax=Streptomyces spiramenti TaxID=2720606 RepID=A0ABX1ALZ1_9ACTN|nr:aldo/keto reductase [Streptomyces spiramenti]